jgi:hypoxanthine phosphoribosyltransferase
MSKITPEYILEVQSASKQLLSITEINQAIDKVSSKVSERFHNKNPICVCVMNGGMPFLSSFMQKMNFPLQIDYVHVSRYLGECYGQAIQWLKSPSIDSNGRDVIIFDDILDGGLTLAEISRYFIRHGASVSTVVLLDRKAKREKGGLIKADYSCFEMEDKSYVYGFGMDYYGYLRNVPGVFAVPDKYVRKS